MTDQVRTAVASLVVVGVVLLTAGLRQQPAAGTARPQRGRCGRAPAAAARYQLN